MRLDFSHRAEEGFRGVPVFRPVFRLKDDDPWRTPLAPDGFLDYRATPAEAEVAAARALGVNTRTMQRWAGGQWPVPARVVGDLLPICRYRAGEMDRAEKLLMISPAEVG